MAVLSYNVRCKMKVVMTCIRDAKGETYSQPWFTTTAAAAVRNFTDLVNDPQRGQTINTHPEDYALYEMGTFEDSDGQFITHPIPKHLVSGSSVKKENPIIDRNHISVV